MASSDPTRITRRIAIVTLAAATAIPTAAMGAAGDDAELLELGRRFEMAFAPCLAMWAKSRADRNAFDEAVYHATGIRWKDKPDRYVDGVEQPEAGDYWETRERMAKEWPNPISQEEWDEVSDAVRDIAEEIEKYQPTTLAGLAVVARAQAYLVSDFWTDDDEAIVARELDGDEIGHRYLIEAVLRMAGAPPPMTAA